MAKPIWLIDISTWQSFTPQTIQLFKQHGLSGGIIRCSQGSNIIDNKLASNVKLFQDAKIPYGVYTWVDPTQDPVKQANLAVSLCNQYDAKFLAGDFEQYWSDWTNYWDYTYNHNGELSTLSSKTIYDVCASFSSMVKQNLNKPFVGYSAGWFINSWCPQLPNLLKTLDYYWNAQYIDFKDPTNDKIISWDDFDYIMGNLPKEHSIPNIKTNIWQIGYLTIAGTFSVDQNIIYSEDDYHKLFGDGIVVEPPIIIPPVELPILDSGIVTATLGLNVRSSPQISANNKLYALKYNSKVNIYQKLPSWYKINSTKEEYASSDYIKVTTSLPVLYQAKVNAPIGLRVRSSPKIVSNNILRTLPDKTIVSVYNVTNNWAKISSTLEEYVSNDYLVKINAAIDPKKGLAMAHPEFQEDLNTLRIGWYYTWGLDKSKLSDSRYIPMSRDGSMVNLPDGYSGYLLFLNEPNQAEPNGCDLSASEAIIRYKALIAKYPNAKLICGNVSAWDTVYSGNFLGEFTKAISDQKLKIPYAYGLHGYIEEWIDVLTLENFWEIQHSICGTKIWITETGDTKANLTNFKQLIEWIKTKDWIERYAVFTNRSNGEDWAIGNGVNLIDWNTGQLTDIGKYYASI